MSYRIGLYKKYHVSYDNGKTLEEEEEGVFHAHLSWNPLKMARKAGIYEACCAPNEIGAEKAKDIIPTLEKGYKDMRSSPYDYTQLEVRIDDDNDSEYRHLEQGRYNNFLNWVKEYIEACKEHPEAIIEVS